jgi:Mn-dependent DtxR family transcriptional regulator
MSSIQSNSSQLPLSVFNSTELQIIRFVFRWIKPIPPNTSDIANGLRFPASTVVSTLSRMKNASQRPKNSELDQRNLASTARIRPREISMIFDWEPHRAVQLTEFGLKVAEHLEQHHHVLEYFLHQTLPLSKEQAHNESDILGTAMTCTLTMIISEKFRIDSWKEACICPETYDICKVPFK